MDCDQLGAVREGRLDLDVANHLWNAFHHVIAREVLLTFAHQLSDRLAIASALEQLCGDISLGD